MLRAATACNFSSLLWPAGSAPAALASLLLTLQSHKSLEKHSESGLSYLFGHLHLLSSYSFSSTLLSSDLSLLSASALLCFSSVHIVGSLTSKLLNFLRLIIRLGILMDEKKPGLTAKGKMPENLRRPSTTAQSTNKKPKEWRSSYCRSTKYLYHQSWSLRIRLQRVGKRKLEEGP